MDASAASATLAPEASPAPPITREPEASAPFRIRLTYILLAANHADAAAKAADIALEQTVELPREAVPRHVESRVVGRVEGLSACADEGRWRAVLSYDPADVGDDLPQLLNLLFGNVSLLPGIKLVDLELPPVMLATFPGPQFGVDGLRRLCGAGIERPLLCVALKPVGLSAAELAERCAALARAGVDVVKDDHGLANQPTAPFDERVRRCQEAVERANALTGGRTLYFPNVTGPVESLMVRLDLARGLGCRGVLVSPMLTGLDTVRWVAEWFGLVILAHPALAGALFQPDHGIAPQVLLGTLFRLIGADGVIYPNPGGRFPLHKRTCDAINRRLRAGLGRLRAAWPVPGGGIDAARVPYWVSQYGPDTMFLLGSSLYAEPDLEAAARRLVESVRTAAE